MINQIINFITRPDIYPVIFILILCILTIQIINMIQDERKYQRRKYQRELDKLNGVTYY